VVEPRGVGAPPGPSLFLAPILYQYTYYLSTDYGKIPTASKLLPMEVNIQRLRELRRQKVLSMRELEEMSGVSYNTIWRLENGITGAQPRTIRKIAQVLGVDPAELVKGEE
jgi:HTH-type transcriptional regulator, competence development regulator